MHLLKGKYLNTVCFVAYSSALLFSSVYFIPPTWDEYLDFSGCVGAFNYGISLLSGRPTDIFSITHDLEWYGNSFRWPAYFLWALTTRFPVRIPEGSDSYDVFLSSTYSASMHFVSALYSILGLYLFWKVLVKLGTAAPLCWFGSAVFATTPIWLANSYWNLKEIPVGVAIMASIYTTILHYEAILTPSRLRGASSPWIYSAINGFILGSILGNKFAYFPIVILLLISQVVFLGSLPASSHDTNKTLENPLCLSKLLALLLFEAFVTLLSAFLLTPQWWGRITYPFESIYFFSHHPLIHVDHQLSLQFFASRLSYVVTLPLFLSLSCITVISGGNFIARRRHLVRLIDSPSIKNIRYLHLTGSTILFLYIIPILVSGRVLYGHDLRHLVWFYPLALINVIQLLGICLSSLDKLILQLVSLLLGLSLFVHLWEVAMLFPHYDSYGGVFTQFLRNDFSNANQQLLFSRYFTYRAPELLAPLLQECSLDDQCYGSVLNLLNSGKAQAKLSFPANPSYVDAYLRMFQARAMPRYAQALKATQLVMRKSGECVDVSLVSLRSPFVNSDFSLCQ